MVSFDSGALAVTFVETVVLEIVAVVVVVVEGCDWKGSCFGFVFDSGWHSARSFLGCFGEKENEHAPVHERVRVPALASGPEGASAFASELEPGIEIGWNNLAFEFGLDHHS